MKSSNKILLGVGTLGLAFYCGLEPQYIVSDNSGLTPQERKNQAAIQQYNDQLVDAIVRFENTPRLSYIVRPGDHLESCGLNEGMPLREARWFANYLLSIPHNGGMVRHVRPTGNVVLERRITDPDSIVAGDTIEVPDDNYDGKIDCHYKSDVRKP